MKKTKKTKTKKPCVCEQIKAFYIKAVEQGEDPETITKELGAFAAYMVKRIEGTRGFNEYLKDLKASVRDVPASH